MKELDEIIGMDEMKKEIKSLYTQINQIAEMEKRGVKIAKPSHHFIITRNLGTGKTTVARLLGKTFEGLGLLDAGHVVEVDRSKLVAGFVSQTAPLVNTVNSGFKSRYIDYLTFDDYDPNEMYAIFDKMCKKKNIQYASGFEDALRNRLQTIYAGKTASFANARIVRQLFDKTRENVASRVMNMKSQGTQEDELKREILVMHPEDLDMTLG